MRFFNIILLAVLISESANANRLSASQLNMGDVESIFIGPGLVTVIELPEDVLEARVGAPHIFKVSISSANSRELLINVADPHPFQTNLVVRTVKRTFIFDLVPSLSRHQDFFQVKGGFGGPEMHSTQIEQAVVLESEVQRRPAGKLIQKAALK